MGFHTVESQELITKTPAVTPPKWKSVLQILRHSVKGSFRAFAVSFFIRGGVSLIIRLFAVLQRRLYFIYQECL
jgi:hypothetical protein